MGIKDWSGDLKAKAQETITDVRRDPKRAIKGVVKKGALAKVFVEPVAAKAEQEVFGTNYVRDVGDTVDAALDKIVDFGWYGGESLIQSNIKTYRWLNDKLNDQESLDPCARRDAAKVGSLVSCPIHGNGVVVAGINTTIVLGHALAGYGDLTSCGATLMPPCRPLMIGGRYIACVGDPTSHGGTILTGVPSLKVC